MTTRLRARHYDARPVLLSAVGFLTSLTNVLTLQVLAISVLGAAISLSAVCWATFHAVRLKRRGYINETLAS